MKYFLLVGVCSISILSSCNLKPKTYEVNMSSYTLTIDNASAIENRAYKGVISLVEPSEDYRLPTLITITVSDKTLDDECYTYDFNTGLLEINANAVTGNITILAERTELDGYKANFICDENIKVFIYKTRDYDTEPRKTNLAYARDKNSGELLKDGSGEINLKVEIDENYDIDMFWVRGLYDKCQDSEKTEKDNVYRITKIRSDLQVTITTKKIYCKKFAASDDLTNNSFSFSWVTRNPENVDHVHIDVTATEYSNSFDVEEDNFTFSNAVEDKVYTFTFTPYLDNGVVGSSYECTRAIIKAPLSIEFPRVEIKTENNELTEMKYPVSNYIQNIIKIYNEQNNIVYDSSKNLSEKEKYEGSKIKIRGNATAVDYHKKPYKIKLKKNADLLESFRAFSNATIDYSNKEWVLLSPNTNNGEMPCKENCKFLNTPVAISVIESLNFDWVPSYQFVNLYYNDDYQGLYILCEQTSRGNGEGDCQSRYKIDNDGYIIEKDLRWWYEDLYFNSPINDEGKFKFTFKYPDTDDINNESEQYIYIKNVMNNIENRILQNDNSCFDFIDKTSLVRWLLAQDIISNSDPFGSNIFLYKKDSSDSSKVYMGTIWDYGISLLIANQLALIRTCSHFYYKWILQFSDLENELRSMYYSNKTLLLFNINECLNSFENTIYNSITVSDSIRWDYDWLHLDVEKQKNTCFFQPTFFISRQ